MFLEEYLAYYYFFDYCSYFTLKYNTNSKFVNWSYNKKDFERMNGLIDESDLNHDKSVSNKFFCSKRYKHIT